MTNLVQVINAEMLAEIRHPTHDVRTAVALTKFVFHATGLQGIGGAIAKPKTNKTAVLKREQIRRTIG